MVLAIRSNFPRNVFELMGRDENSATYALGWALERSPCLASAFASRIAGSPVDSSEIRISLQTHGEDRGFTDMEIRCGSELHAIVEAKQGFAVPTSRQLSRYRPRLDTEPADARALVSVSALPAPIARRRLPAEIGGVPIKHLSWGNIRGLANEARRSAGSVAERLWLSELVLHLESYAAMNRTRSNMVWVVSLSSDPMRTDGPRTWIQVVEEDRRYFHPVGDGGVVEPPNYIAFRHGGELRSVHRIVSFDIVTDLSTVDPTWVATNADHFVYTLGPAMLPARRMGAAGPNDTIKRATRVWCAIDTLLTGEFDQLGQARDETTRRIAAAEADNE